MFTRNQLEQILFLDIETASVAPSYEELPEAMQGLWARKAELLRERTDEPHTAADLYRNRAAIFAEFGKVVCVSCGVLRFQGDQPTIKLKSFYGTDEKAILADLSAMMNPFLSKPERNLCAHNGKEFDFPYLGRRYLINGLPLPGVLADMQSKKPWEIKLLDTMQLWKFGDYKSFTSLDLLCAVFDIPSPKEGMDGSQVGRVYWEEGDVARIAAYCERDVVATAQVLLRMSGEGLIADGGILSPTVLAPTTA
jgi:3'-5' exonuclease